MAGQESSSGGASTEVYSLTDRLEASKLNDMPSELQGIIRTLMPKRCNGYAGHWRFYKCDMASSMDERSLNAKFRCLRMYRLTGTDPVEAEYFNIYESPPATCSTQQREQDGLYDNSYRRPLTDSYFKDTTALTESELKENIPGCLFWRFIAIDASDYVRMPPFLPPKPQPEIGDMTVLYPGWSPRNIVSGVWAFEAFFRDGPWRWSMGPLYSIRTLELISHFCIVEHATEFVPEDAVDFDGQPWQNERPRLSESVDTWLDKGAWVGEMTEMMWDEDGDLIRLEPRPASWTPPQSKSGSHKLLLYQDAMYAFYPLRLPDVRRSRSVSFKKGERFAGSYVEVGGLMRDHLEFRRLIVRFNPTGELLSLTKEVYRPASNDKFDFHSRNRNNVRRSVDLRRSQSGSIF